MKILLYLAPSPIDKPKANLIQSLCQYNELKLHFDSSYYFVASSLSKDKTKELISYLSPLKSIPRGIFSLKRLKIKYRMFIINSIYQIIATFLVLAGSFIVNLFRKNKIVIYIYSRSMIASSIISLFVHKKHIFELHGIENVALLQKIQVRLVKSENIKNIYISDSLRRLYKDERVTSKVLHDSSPYYEKLILPEGLSKRLQKIKNNFLFTCVYSGSSGEGRGLNLIYSLAALVPECNFLIFSDVEDEKKI